MYALKTPTLTSICERIRFVLEARIKLTFTKQHDRRHVSYKQQIYSSTRSSSGVCMCSTFFIRVLLLCFSPGVSFRNTLPLICISCILLLSLYNTTYVSHVIPRLGIKTAQAEIIIKSLIFFLKSSTDLIG